MPLPPAKPPRLIEAEVQTQIVDGLRALGYEVLVTSARGRNRRETGVDHGVPDLFVTRRTWGLGMLGIEIKRPGGAVRWSHDRQRELFDGGQTAVARSLEEACFAIVMFERLTLRFPEALSMTVERLAYSVPKERRQEVWRGRQ